jgi:cysteinyl-tRNA synthetase
MDRTLGLGLRDLAKRSAEAVSLDVVSVNELPEDIQAILHEREEARTRKDWARSDELRLTLKMRGFAVEDKPDGQKVTRV